MTTDNQSQRGPKAALPTAETELTGPDAEAQLDRRSFLTRSAGVLGLALAGGSLATLLNSCEDDATRGPVDTDPGNAITVELNIAEEEKLQAVGGSLKRSFGSNNGGFPLIIVRTAEDRFRAYTAKCTHQACPVEEDLVTNRIWCACHDSYFDPNTGIPFEGSQARLPLQEFQSEFDAETQKLTITF